MEFGLCYIASDGFMSENTVMMFERCLNGDGGSVWLRWHPPWNLSLKSDRFHHQSGCPIPTTTFPQSVESRSIGGPI